MAGNYAATAAPGEPGLWDLEPAAVAAPEVNDRWKNQSSARVAWDLYRPAIQAAVPMEHASEVLHKLAEYIGSDPTVRASLPRVGVLVFKTDERFPLAPQPESPLALAILLRPQVADRAVIDKLLPYLRTVGLRALEIGGRVSLSSISVGLPDFCTRQFGRTVEELRRLKNEVDPLWLCNRDVVEGFIPRER